MGERVDARGQAHVEAKRERTVESRSVSPDHRFDVVQECS